MHERAMTTSAAPTTGVPRLPDKVRSAAKFPNGMRQTRSLLHGPFIWAFNKISQVQHRPSLSPGCEESHERDSAARTFAPIRKQAYWKLFGRACLCDAPN